MTACLCSSSTVLDHAQRIVYCIPFGESLLIFLITTKSTIWNIVAREHSPGVPLFWCCNQHSVLFCGVLWCQRFITTISCYHIDYRGSDRYAESEYLQCCQNFSMFYWGECVLEKNKGHIEEWLEYRHCSMFIYVISTTPIRAEVSLLISQLNMYGGWYSI